MTHNLYSAFNEPQETELLYDTIDAFQPALPSTLNMQKFI